MNTTKKQTHTYIFIRVQCTPYSVHCTVYTAHAYKKENCTKTSYAKMIK